MGYARAPKDEEREDGVREEGRGPCGCVLVGRWGGRGWGGGLLMKLSTKLK